jgi:predicted secreted hydrolase
VDAPQSDDWRTYPFQLVPADPQLNFPAAEGNHPECESDTWFVAGELTADSGRQFAFLTIFNKNRPGESIVADFYTFALSIWPTAITGRTPTTTCRRPTCSRGRRRR